MFRLLCIRVQHLSTAKKLQPAEEGGGDASHDVATLQPPLAALHTTPRQTQLSSD